MLKDRSGEDSVAMNPAKDLITGIFASGKIAFPKNMADTTLRLYFDDNKTHHIYIVAKDSARNVSEVYYKEIKPYTPNEPPVAKNPIPLRKLRIDTIVYVTARQIADDPNEDDNLTITDAIDAIDATDGSGEEIIELSSVIDTFITADERLKIKANSPGFVKITVEVDDHSTTLPPPSGKDTVTIPIAVLHPTPAAEIDYVNETLTNLTPGDHVFNGGDTVRIPADGDTTTIRPAWFGTTVSVQYVVRGIPEISSEPQAREIPARPAAPNLTAVNETFAGYKDGYIYGFRDGMEYKQEGDTVWKPVDFRTLEDLAPGKVYARYRAIAEKSFAGVIDTVTVNGGQTNISPINRPIWLPSVPGITSDPVAGITHVISTTNFKFTLFVGSGQPAPTVQYRRGPGEKEDLPPDPDSSDVAGGVYKYVIRAVQSPVAVYINGYSGGGDITDVAPIAERSSVWSSDGQLYIRTENDDTVTVYGITGQRIKHAELSSGTTSIPLKGGIYIVALKRSGERRKIVVR